MMMRHGSFALGLTVALAACGDDTAGGSEADEGWRLSGGETTVFDRTSAAFSFPSANLSSAEFDTHVDGDAAFEAAFVTDPGEVNAGLGPLFNNTACANCHIENGRGMPVIGDPRLRSQALVRVSLAEGEPDSPGGAVPVPGLGVQLQDQATYGVAPEAAIELDYIEHEGVYADGDRYTLREPVLTITLADGAALPPEVMTSMRQPPPTHGLGLLEAVPEAAILALADPDDADGDGISGRPNYVWSVQLQAAALGRFSPKANQPTLLQQAAGAYANDMGVTNPLFTGPEGTTDIDLRTVELAAFYVQTLAVPARAGLNPEIERGEALFAEAQCGACHADTLRTGSDSPIEALRGQTFHPYTDLLLHDLGPGLADGRPDYEATGSEWRTAPLWGIGVTHTVLPGSGFLHDGRARTIEEAILWHGGEAQVSRDTFVALRREDRQALLAFLQSL